MFTKNVGSLDRIARIVLGLALLLGFILDSGASYRWAYLIGIVPLATGLLSTCPLYTVFGFRTCPLAK